MPSPWTATVLTLFPQAFPGPLGLSVVGRGLEQGFWALETLDIRDFAMDKHRSVDDTPAGGGAGMIMRADVLSAAFDAAAAGQPADRPAFLLSPRGRPLRQADLWALAQGPGVILVCGRFEGVDARFADARQVEEVSVADIILAGGEVAAMALLEGVARILPGVVGDPQSTRDESFEGGLLEYPQYTRPAVWEGRAIPPVLVSGDHGAVAQWRQEQRLAVTRQRRPDLWAAHSGEAGAKTGAGPGTERGAGSGTGGKEDANDERH